MAELSEMAEPSEMAESGRSMSRIASGTPLSRATVSSVATSWAGSNRGSVNSGLSHRRASGRPCTTDAAYDSPEPWTACTIHRASRVRRAVGIGFCDLVGAERGAGARLVLYNRDCIETDLRLAVNRPRSVVDLAWQTRRDHPDGAAGIGRLRQDWCSPRPVHRDTTPLSRCAFLDPKPNRQNCRGDTFAGDRSPISSTGFAAVQQPCNRNLSLTQRSRGNLAAA